MARLGGASGPLDRWRGLLAGSPASHGLTVGEARAAGLPAQPVQVGVVPTADKTLYGLGAAATAATAKYLAESPPYEPAPSGLENWKPGPLYNILRGGLERGINAYKIWSQPTEAQADAQPMGEALRELGEQAKAAGKLYGVETLTGPHQLGALVGTPLAMALEGQDFGDAYTEMLTGLPGGEWAHGALERASEEYRAAGGGPLGELAVGLTAPMSAGDIVAAGGLAIPFIRGGGRRAASRPGKLGSAEELERITPRTREQLFELQPTRAAKAKPESGLPIRTMTPEDALEHARSGAHLRKGAKGAWVGAPRGVNAPRHLKKMRARYDKYVEAGQIGAPWYKRSRAAFEEVAPPGQTGVLAREMAVTSPGARMPTNTNWGVGVHQALETGTPPPSLRFHAREWPVLQQRTGSLSMKTEPFRQNLTPGEPYAPGGVHDVWDLAAWGYKNPKGEYLQGAGETQHRFMDAETVLAVERANLNRLGGRENWSADEVQASAWVGYRALENPRYKRNEITLEQALDEAKLDYSDYLQEHAAYVTYEHTPYGGSGHRPEIAGWPIERQREYGMKAGLVDPKTGHDLLYDVTGIPQYSSLEGVGTWVDPATGKVEQNWSVISRPLVSLQPGKVGDVSEESRAILDSVETFRGWLLGQGMSAWHKEFPVGGPNQPPVSAGTGHRVTHGRALTQAEMAQTAQTVKPYGYGDPSGYVAGRGAEGTVMTEFGPKGGALAGEEANIRGGLAATGVPLEGMERVKVVGPEYDVARDVPVPAFWKEWLEDPQKSAVTAHMLDVVSRTPDVARRLFSDPRVKEVAQALLKRDAGAENVNPRWLEGLRMFAESDDPAAALAAAVQRGGEVAMIALTLGGLLAGLTQGGEGNGAA